jgi:hypothetical protein
MASPGAVSAHAVHKYAALEAALTTGSWQEWKHKWHCIVLQINGYWAVLKRNTIYNFPNWAGGGIVRGHFRGILGRVTVFALFSESVSGVA